MANRKRKAPAALHWAKAAGEAGCCRANSEFHAHTDRILTEHALKEMDEEGDSKPTTEPMARS